METQAGGCDKYSIADLSRLVEGVPGWMSLAELWTLFNLVCGLRVQGRLTNVVEIGAWAGRSTLALALSVKLRGDALLYSIDPHFGDLNYGIADTYPLLLNNLRRTELGDVVQVVRATSRRAFGDWTNGEVDLIVHDGSDQYEEALEEFTEWQAVLASPSTVVVVDPFKKTVMRAIEQTLLAWRSPYADPRLLGNLLVVRYQPRTRARLIDVAQMTAARLRIRVWSRLIELNRISPESVRRIFRRLRNFRSTRI